MKIKRVVFSNGQVSYLPLGASLAIANTNKEELTKQETIHEIEFEDFEKLMVETHDLVDGKMIKRDS